MFGMRSVMFGALRRRHTGRMVYCLRKPKAAVGRRGFHAACRPPCKRLASAIRARHGRHGKRTLYRDVAGTEPASTLAAGSKEDVILYVFGNDLEACFKRQ